MARALDLDAKVELLVASAAGESCGYQQPATAPERLNGAVFHAVAGSRTVPLLKVLLSNACQNQCHYCGIRATSGTQHCTITPDEMARSFDLMRRAGLVSGLFLSSAICQDPVRTMDRLLDTVDIVRGRYGFTGYVHLKVMPGSELSQIERAGLIADRVSVNLEAPSQERLGVIAPDKRFDDLIGLIRTISGLHRSQRGYSRSGTTTQFVAGASGESDRELLQCAGMLYGQMNLRRAYYSGYRPMRGSPLEDVPAMPATRELRLYQADALVRDYGFTVAELAYGEDDCLDLRRDPKEAYAAAHPELFPLEVNRATRAQLMRVPGIGPTGADRVLAARRKATLRELGQLRMLGVRASACAPYVLLNGRRPEMQSRLPGKW